MAQHYYSAADAGFAALWTQLQINGSKSAPSITTFNGKSAAHFGGNFNQTLFYLAGLGTQAASQILETTLLLAVNDDDATNNVGPAFLIQGTDLSATAYTSDRTYADDGWLRRYRNSSLSTLGSNNSLPIAAAAGNWIWMRLRQEPQGDGSVNLKLKVWDEVDPEPAAWAIETSDSAANRITTAGYMGLFIRDSTNSYVAATGVGIGEEAPTGPAGPVDSRMSVTVEQTPEVTPRLSVAGSSPLPLAATLEQTSASRALSNDFQTYLYGFWNPGTASDGPLTWPYSYRASYNKLVLDSGRFVGSTGVPFAGNFIELRFSEISTAPYTDFAIGAKINSVALSQSKGARFGFLDSVSGAHAQFRIWDGAWTFDSYDGSSVGKADSGTLDAPINLFSITYNPASGTYLLSINGSVVSSSVNIPGINFDSAFWQTEFDSDTVSTIEELYAAASPSKSPNLQVYIRPDVATIKTGSEAQASLQVGSGRRLGATLEQGSGQVASPSIKQALRLDVAIETGSSLQALSGQSLPLSCNAEQGSDLAAAFGQNLALASTVTQDSSLQSSLTLGLSLSATVAQSSSLLASLGFATGLPLSSTVESGSDLPTTLRLGAGFQVILPQTAGVQASLRIGAGMGANVYTDSAVSVALGMGVRLSGMVDQPTTVIGGLAFGTTLRLQSDIAGTATIAGTMTGSAVAASEAILEQGSALSLSMAVAVPAGPSLLEQNSALQVALKVAIPLSALAEQGSTLVPALQASVRLTAALSQESEMSGPTLETGKRFSTVVATQSALAISLDAPHFVGQTDARLEQEAEIVASLKLSIRFQSVLPQSQATLLAMPKAKRALRLAPIQSAGLVRTILRVPAIGSTGWLTVSDIFFHNDYYSEVVFEQVPASEITVVPALRIDTLSIMPA